MTIQKNLSPDEQWNLGKRMIEASRQGDRETVQTLAAYGVADVCAIILPRPLGYAPRALATGLAQLA